MTRMSLVFASAAVACVIGLSPQQETGAAFRPALVKTRSLSAPGVKPEQVRALARDICRSQENQTCRNPIPGSSGPRG